MDALDWIHGELEGLAARALRRPQRTRGGPQGAEVVVAGRPVLNFASNDYLGLAADPRLVAAACRAAEAEGAGAGASPLITGRGEWLARLESQLAEFEGCPAALVFPSGYAANVGAITALAGEGDCIYSDALNHASIIDGCRLSRARVEVYPHADSAYLAQRLAEGRRYRRRLIVTDGLFSMDGDLAPLAELGRLAAEHQAMLLVDEAHATGVLGAQGRGAAEALAAEKAVHVRVGTLSKALGAAGGFVCGPAHLIEWLRHAARPYMFSTAPPPPICAAASAALELIAREPHRRQTLLAHAAALRRELAAQGWNIGPTVSHIIPLMLGDAQRALDASQQLADQGLLVPAIRPPTVPQGGSRLRISLSFAHTPEMLDRLLAACRTLMARAGLP
jgi:8-amino-7-oxononanoate synthase